MRYKSTYGTRTFGRRSLNESRLLLEGKFATEVEYIKKISSEPSLSGRLDRIARALDLFLTGLADPRLKTLKTGPEGGEVNLQTALIEMVILLLAENTEFAASFRAMKGDTLKKISVAAEKRQEQGQEQAQTAENRYRTGRMVESRRPALNRKPTRRYL